MSASGNLQLQFEAVWSITSISNNERAREIVQSGAVQPLLSLLSSPSWEIKYQAAWAIAIIARSSEELRDQLLNQGAMQEMINTVQRGLQETVPVRLIRGGTFALSELCHGEPSPPLELVSPCLPLLKVLLDYPDDEVVIDALWAVSYFLGPPGISTAEVSPGRSFSSARVDAVIAAAILPDVVKFITFVELSKALPAVRIIGNVTMGGSQYIDMVLEMNILPGYLVFFPVKIALFARRFFDPCPTLLVAHLSMFRF